MTPSTARPGSSEPGTRDCSAGALVEAGFAVGFAAEPCGKETSEDFFDFACPSATERRAHGQAFALADGMSGGAGRRAAETCVATVLSDFYATPASWDMARRFDRVIGALNGWLLAHNLQAGGRNCMLSTLSVLVLHEAQFHVAHVGDSRIYRLRRGQCECLTVDHVWPRADMRHVLRRAVGLDRHLVVDTFTEMLHPGDRFLLASDGVWEVLGDNGLATLLAGPGSPRDVAAELVQGSVAKQRGYYGRNDATAAVIDVRDAAGTGAALALRG
jgi:protein phosphatase